MQLPAELASELRETACYGGSSLLLVQAGGGNNSVKSRSADVLWVKSSGKRLAEVTATRGTVALRCSALQRLVPERQPSFRSPQERRRAHEEIIRSTAELLLDAHLGRPSLETLFHALLGDVVLHLHPVYLNALACMQGGHELLRDVAPQPFVWVPYATPGWELACAVRQCVQASSARSEACSFLLENHGFIASAGSAKQVIGITESFLALGTKLFGTISPLLVSPQPITEARAYAAGVLRAIFRERWSDRDVVVRPAQLGVFQELDHAAECFASPGPLVPDDVVYGCETIYRTSLSALRDFIGSLPDPPPERLAIAVEGTGTLLVAPNEPLASALEQLLAAHVLVRMLIARRGSVRVLPQFEIEYLRSMESEKYRVRMCASGAS